jgi:hypothetical protein
MITAADFSRIRALLGQQAEDDIEWAQTLGPPADADEFALEIIFVVCNSGMQNKVARGIYDRVCEAIKIGLPVIGCFRHVGKVAAIELIWRDRERLFLEYCASTERLAYLESLPWIGPVTKYHAAKNFGLDVAKPDVHLQRLADREGCTVQALCERLAKETGLRVAAVDTVLWRACANGVMNSKSGRFTRP